MEKIYRYPGVKPFKSQEREMFFGRDEDIDRLFNLVLSEKLVALFGKSGYGKSSLLNAGLIPLFQQENDEYQYTVIEVRLGNYIEGKTISPVDAIIMKLKEKTDSKQDSKGDSLDNENFLDAFYSEYGQEPPLWVQFKNRQKDAINNRFLLVFDQFEEFFSYPKSLQEHFKLELAELLYSDIPHKIHKKISGISPKQRELLMTPMTVKALITVRSDRISYLNSMTDLLPAILHKRYELKALTKEHAKEAIVNPAALVDPEKFITPSFSYTEKAIEKMLEALEDTNTQHIKGIEAFQLQILCQYIERSTENDTKKGIPHLVIHEDDLPEMSNLYENYYKRQLDKLSEGLSSDDAKRKKASAQFVLEKGLLYEDSQSGECRRISVDAGFLHSQFKAQGVTNELLHELEGTFLLRKDENNVGGWNYEISHDTLVSPILKVKKEREDSEALKKGIRNYSIQQLRKASLTAIIILIITSIYFNQELYFAFKAFSSNSNKPFFSNSAKLENVIDSLTIQIEKDAETMGKDKFITLSEFMDVKTKKLIMRPDTIQGIDPWSSSQMITALLDKKNFTLNDKFINLCNKQIVSECCCWSEIKQEKDMNASGWVMSAIGRLGLTNELNCDGLDFFLKNQLIDGSWSLLEIDSTFIKYGSTYSTCHALLALQSNYNNLSDNSKKRKMKKAISKGIAWLKKSYLESKKPKTIIWLDYPNGNTTMSIKTMGLTGLALHTLNVLGQSNTKINQQWLNNLDKNRPLNIDITYREQSNMQYKIIGVGGDKFQDNTRHLEIPWTIIATIDAFKDANYWQKINVAIWVSNMIKKLDIKEISKEQVYVRAEILIGLKYLQGHEFDKKVIQD